jgi:hypothetical protein
MKPVPRRIDGPIPKTLEGARATLTVASSVAQVGYPLADRTTNWTGPVGRTSHPGRAF